MFAYDDSATLKGRSHVDRMALMGCTFRRLEPHRCQAVAGASFQLWLGPATSTFGEA
jgi:hypothetical protein